MFAWRVQNAVPLPCCTLTTPPRLNPELEMGVANPNNAGGQEIIKDLEMDRYTSVDDLKAKLCDQFSEYTEGCETQFGYVLSWPWNER